MSMLGEPTKSTGEKLKYVLVFFIRVFFFVTACKKAIELCMHSAAGSPEPPKMAPLNATNEIILAINIIRQSKLNSERKQQRIFH